MVQILKINSTDTESKAVVELYADTLSELTNTTAIGSINLAGGSFAYDKTGAVAILDSEGNWNTVE